MKAIVLSCPSLRLSRLWIVVGILGAGVIGLVQPSLAQTATSADLQTPVGSSDRSANSNGDLNNINTMFDLLHRAQLGSIRDPYEFNRDQQQNINTAASTFRQRQMELLHQQGQSQSQPQGQIGTTPSSQTPTSGN